MRSNLVDITGHHFGRLTVIDYAEKSKWRCRCDCGNVVDVNSYHLRSGQTRNCGCLFVETARKRATIHGYAIPGKVTRIHKIWRGMIQRCTNPRCNSYTRYGGRGIIVCRRWRSFVNFLADMGEPPKGMSIDRIDNNGNYEPSNCRWATAVIQQRNRRDNRILEYDSQRMCVAAWAEHSGIKDVTIRGRLRRGWTVGQALA